MDLHNDKRSQNCENLEIIVIPSNVDRGKLHMMYIALTLYSVFHKVTGDDFDRSSRQGRMIQEWRLLRQKPPCCRRASSRRMTEDPNWF